MNDLRQWTFDNLEVKKEYEDGIEVNCPLASHGKIDTNGHAKVFYESRSLHCIKEDKTVLLSELAKELNIPDPYKPENNNGKIYYDYKKNGKLLYTHVRLPSKPGESKKMPWNQPNGITKQPPQKDRVLYHHDEAVKALENKEPLFICEGEKDTDRVISNGHKAVCSGTGATKTGKPWPEHYFDIFSKGDTVYMVPDADEPGQKFMKNNADIFQSKGVDVHWLDLGYPITQDHGKDISDYLDAGEDLQKLIDTKQDINVEEKSTAWRIMKAGDIDMTPLVYLVDDVLETDCNAELFGETGSYKSFMLFDMSVCISAGIPWHGHNVKQSPVVLFLGEGLKGFRLRIKALELKYGISVDDIPLYVSTAPISLIDSAFMDNVRQVIATMETTPGLIAIDTLNMNYGRGNESGTEDMTQAVQEINKLRIETGATVLVVHHPGLTNLKRGRGSGVLNNAMDRTYRLDKDKGDKIAMVCTKSKETEKPAKTFFKLTQVDIGEEKPSAVLSDTTAPDRIITLTGKTEKKIWKILKNLFDVEIEELDAEGKEPEEAIIQDDVYREACTEAGIGRSSIYIVKAKLEEMGNIRCDGKSIYLY